MLKNFLVVALLLPIATCRHVADDLEDREKDLPIFSQSDCLEEDQCDFCVKVDFPKDGADDIVCLHSTEEDTIFEGHLKKESDVAVTVILPDEDNEATVVFHSEHGGKCSVFGVDMHTMETKCIQGLTFNDGTPHEEDRHYTDPVPERTLEERSISPRSLDPKGYKISLVIMYDDTFKKLFKNKASKKIKEIMAVSNNLYKEKASLTTTIQWDVLAIDHAKGQDWTTGGSYQMLRDKMSPLAVSHKTEANLYLFIGGVSGKGGVAYDIGTVCDKDRKRRCCYTEFITNAATDGASKIVQTAEFVIHELGHNLGMRHDFWDRGNGCYKQLPASGGDVLCGGWETCAKSQCKQGKGPGDYKPNPNGSGKCTGYMDYADGTDVWSKCSVRDFLFYLNGLNQNCLTVATPTATTTTTVAPTTPKATTCTNVYEYGCDDWAKLGDCDGGIFVNWMAENCKKACNKC